MEWTSFCYIKFLFCCCCWCRCVRYGKKVRVGFCVYTMKFKENPLTFIHSHIYKTQISHKHTKLYYKLLHTLYSLKFYIYIQLKARNILVLGILSRSLSLFHSLFIFFFLFLVWIWNPTQLTLSSTERKYKYVCLKLESEKRNRLEIEKAQCFIRFQRLSVILGHLTICVCEKNIRINKILGLWCEVRVLYSNSCWESTRPG